MIFIADVAGDRPGSGQFGSHDRDHQFSRNASGCVTFLRYGDMFSELITKILFIIVYQLNVSRIFRPYCSIAPAQHQNYNITSGLVLL